MQKSRLHISHIVLLLLITLGALFHDVLPPMLENISAAIARHLGWLILLICSGFVVFCTYIAFGKYGSLKLGAAGEKPQFSRFSWFAMLFAAGMGSGLVFNGAAEPLTHFTDFTHDAMPFAEKAAQARHAMAITFFHWGIHAWAIYAIAALSVAYFAFHRHTAMLPSVPAMFHKTGKFANHAGHAINIFAIIAVIVGLTATLSKGSLQLASGFARIFPDTGFAPESLHVLLFGLIVIAYMFSAVSGISKGIKYLSNINVILAIGLFLFVLFAGPTSFLLNHFTASLGDYISSFTSLSFDTHPYDQKQNWLQNWTISYLLWWVAWGPFVGVFIARISRGRTLKEFMLGVVLAPSLFSILWFSIFGGFGFHLEFNEAPGWFTHITHIQDTTFAQLTYLPFEQITSFVTLILLFIFLVTSADSGTYVLSMFSSDGKLTPAISERLFWGLIIATITMASLLSGKGIALFRALVIAGAAPYLFIMLWQVYGLMHALIRDAKEKS